jgi:hypothetical protein
MAETEDLLKRQRQELDARIKELHPCVGEYELLKAALDALNDAGTTASTQEAKTPKTTKRRSSSTSSSKDSGNGRRGRPPGSGKRKDQLLDIITRNPGISIADATTVMAMASNYGYKLRDQLLEEGSIEYEGQGFKPTGKSPVEETSEPAQEQTELAEEPIGEQPSEETAEQGEEPIQEQTTEPAEAVESSS